MKHLPKPFAVIIETFWNVWLSGDYFQVLFSDIAGKSSRWENTISNQDFKSRLRVL